MEFNVVFLENAQAEIAKEFALIGDNSSVTRNPDLPRSRDRVSCVAQCTKSRPLYPLVPCVNLIKCIYAGLAVLVGEAVGDAAPALGDHRVQLARVPGRALLPGHVDAVPDPVDLLPGEPVEEKHHGEREVVGRALREQPAHLFREPLARRRVGPRRQVGEQAGVGLVVGSHLGEKQKLEKVPSRGQKWQRDLRKRPTRGAYSLSPQSTANCAVHVEPVSLATVRLSRNAPDRN
ncbi:hypothetical protein THAOC_36205 [Thalassiosira oceanica]|uniref:Uncharacterized protein n=1 Tax=Thalassiosira oceanica TaxID=159749 RepID=K0QZT8_THAOC|nr:hypothetical protein THAOC_36205 [Thalassiosira oceanica]|eukprot:EJK45193.1 hypothetical protein THAOC_36205 [Thalassiosira oceanica]